MQFHPLFTDEYLLSHWDGQFANFVETTDDGLLAALRQWADRDTKQTESQLEGQFVQTFFHDLWGYVGTGKQESESEYTLVPQYPVKGAGQRGGTGKADLALGLFRRTDIPDVPQVLCEFKDIKSSLDAPQSRKGNTRSPVEQCLDYLKYSFDDNPYGSALEPTWGLVTDMNEFRLYFRKKGREQFLRFVISGSGRTSNGLTYLTDDTPLAQRRRFLFWKTFQKEMLIAPFGRSEMEKLFESQIVREKALEKSFYLEYKAYRQYVYETIVDSNPKFAGSKKELVRLTQRFLDRCIFLLFCEDMGKTLGFPVDLVRDILIEASTSTYYASTGSDIWARIRALFDAMRDGGEFPPDHKINRFNGGLFEKNSKLEGLIIPNRVFCCQGQGESSEAIAEFKNTLLYLSATYNFGAEGTDRAKTITLYALGRIFEQSITELEFMEAEAEAAQLAVQAGKDINAAVKKAKSIAKLNKRKRNGVYYTPEWVTNYIVREVVGARLNDECQKLELEIGRSFTENQLKTYRSQIGEKKKASENVVVKHVKQLDKYEEFLSNIKIVDPACGSGAFLIQTLQFLLSQHEVVVAERARLAGSVGSSKLIFEQDDIIRDILTNNLYGVDLSPESVEIAQLALWLNTARKDKPLSTLDHHIREGNSLVGPDFTTFYKNKHDKLFGDLDEDTREKVNPFDWKATFPEIFGDDLPFEQRGFDCVVGNPPYVKLQNFRKIKADESDYLMTHASGSGVPVYHSTRTGNWDLYLPFIEKGIDILNSNGRMGYIAPNVWLKNEYGEALRKRFTDTKQLDRWIDFKSFQVFDEATVYTSLQFFTRSQQRLIKFFQAFDGDVVDVDWDEPAGAAPSAAMSATESWILLYEDEWRLFKRLKDECDPLDQVADEIFVGIQTSADWFYHLDRSNDGKFYQTKPQADKSPPDGVKYDLEPGILKPLVSGTEAKRYLRADTNTYVLFPYDLSGERPRLWSQDEMVEKFPQTWAYLKRYEKQLRKRESNKMDVDDSWWAYNYPKNLDKQELAKLGVAETVPALRLFADPEGNRYLNNVRVNGIIPKHPAELFFLLGVLNSPVPNWVFTRIAKPKDNGFYESNKQFIAPLPVPKATEPQKEEVAKLAKSLQENHTLRRDKIAQLQQRIDSPNCLDVSFEEDWLWADVKPLADLKLEAPADITAARAKTAWAKTERQSRLDTHFEKINALMTQGMELDAICEDDALMIKSGELTLLTKFGLKPDEAKYLACLWSQILRHVNVTASFDAKKLVGLLLNLRSTEDAGLRKTLLQTNEEIQTLDADIAKSEVDINELIYQLYGFSEQERRLVESSSL